MFRGFFDDTFARFPGAVLPEELVGLESDKFLRREQQMSRQTGFVSGFLTFILLPPVLADAYAQPAGNRGYPARPIRIVIPCS